MIVSSKILGVVSKFALGKEFVIIAILVLIISLLVSSYLNQRRMAFLPGLAPLPIIGNAHQIAPHINRFVEWIGDITEGYGGTTRIWIASHCAVLTCDSDLIQRYYTSPQANGNFVTDIFKTIVAYMLGEGLISATGRHWEFSRKSLAPTFTTTILKNFVPVISKHAQELVEKMGRKPEGKPVQLSEDLALCSFMTIAETHLQIKAEDMIDPEKVLSKMNDFTHLMQTRGFTPWQKPERLYHLLPSGKMALDIKNYFNNYLGYVRQKAVERMEERQFEGDQEWKKKVFINALIQNKGYTEQQVIDELATIIAAGSETSANGLGFILLMLGQYQEVQQRVYEEDLKILEEACGREIDHTDLQKYEYLDRVIKETLRLFPVVPMLYRRLTVDMPYGKNIIPKGTELLMHIFKMQRDPNTYPDPLKFDPDRFLPENIAKRHPFAYMPFGYGNRICLGWKFSTMSMKTVISTVIRNFRVYNDTPIEKLELITDLTLKDVNNVTLRLERR